MSNTRTLAIIKPDATASGYTEQIISMIKENGFTIVAEKSLQLTKEQAEKFYDVHAGRPFYDELTTFMSSGPVTVLALERSEAIKGWRDLMGATNPANAAENTVRKLYAKSVGENAVHGSDAEETAKQEIAFFFPHLA